MKCCCLKTEAVCGAKFIQRLKPSEERLGLFFHLVAASFPQTSMNPYRPSSSPPSPPPYSDLQDVSHNPPALVQTGHSSVILDSAPCRFSLDPHGGLVPVRSPGSALPGFSLRSPDPVVNPYPGCQVSVLVPEDGGRCSEDRDRDLDQDRDLDLDQDQDQDRDLDLDLDQDQDLECSICFSQFNNVFRCPKVLQCRHTFCLECLARINVKASEPSAIQCPLCRSFTPLPALGLPKLDTDSHVLSCLPAAMQRVYSVRFIRNEGKLQVKRPSDGQRRWGRRSLASLRSVSRSLDVGLPSPPAGGVGQEGGVGGALFRLTGRPACRAFLLTLVVMMLLMLTAIIIFLLTYRTD